MQMSLFIYGYIWIIFRMSDKEVEWGINKKKKVETNI